MGLSKSLKLRIAELSSKDMKNLLKMVFEDKVSYLDIKKKFDFTLGEIEKILLKELGEKRFKRWKIRQERRSTHKGRLVKRTGAIKNVNL